MKPKTNSPSPQTTTANRAVRTEAFRRKNARRRALRAEQRARLTVGQYLEWRRQMRLLPFHSEKAQRDILEGKSLSQGSPERSSVRRAT
ncbi:MAG: hypothetical protein ACKOCE_02210 [Acidimicrobiia bacterium]